MPDRHNIKNIDLRKAATQALIEGKGGHEEVTPVDEAAAQAKGAGFRVNWDGVEYVADKEARTLLENYEKNPGAFEVNPLKESGETEITDTETGESKRFDSKILFGPDAPALETEAIIEEETATAEEPEVKVLPEDAFLKYHGLYNNFIKSMDDVDRDVKYHRERILKNDGYVGNEILFSDESTETPENKVETLKMLRKVSEALIRERRAGEPQKQEPVKVTTAYDRMTTDEKEILGDPTHERYMEVMDKWYDYKHEQKSLDLRMRLDKIEWDQTSKEKQLKDEEAKQIVKEVPELRAILSDPKVPMSRKAYILARMRVGSEDDGKAMFEAGRNHQIKLETKRKASIRMSPTKPAQRTVSPGSDRKDREFMAKIAELRRQRKTGSSVRVAPEIEKYLQTLG